MRISLARSVSRNRALPLAGLPWLVAASAALAGFEPRFVVLSATNNPGPELRWADLGPGLRQSYNVLTWPTRAEEQRARPAARDRHVADGFDLATDQPAGAGRTFDVFRAGRAETVTGTADWTFPDNARFTLRATRTPGDEPAVTFTFTAKVAGWYSIGYTGAPAVEPQAADEIWQPLIWQERRFPNQPYLTEAGRCTLPGTFVARGGRVYGVVADPAELPFQPLPTVANSRFGVAVRNAEGRAQPTLFAPILGGAGSRLPAGGRFTFTLRLIDRPGRITEVYEALARGLFGFRDYRSNDALGSLNRTLERMIDFAMGPWARFDTDLRGSAYETDVPGSVKNVSALHPLGVALVTDDERIFEQRAKPMLEALLSREKFLFTTDPKVTGQGASANLTGPCAPVSELAAWHRITGSPCLLRLARECYGKTRTLNLGDAVAGDTWQGSLALYRATGDDAWLKRARAGADAYIEARLATAQRDFRDKAARGMFFWTSYAPNWMELFELSETTGERRYLDAAREGARRYAEFVWMCPAIPDGDVQVQADGSAPLYRKGPKFPPIRLPAEQVPAWRVSEIGLTCESSGTSKGHRAIFLATHAPYMLRLAGQTGDLFLHDIARSAVVGRYTSFPGYHMNTARTTVYEKPNFAERPTAQINSTSSLHYNHIWPQVALVLDYLVADAEYRSGGAIRFPSHCAEGYAYLQGRVYGDRPGTFCGATNVWLWMPKGLLTCDQPEVNYIAARGNGKLYIALLNEAARAVTATCTLAPSGSRFTVTIPPRGLVPHVVEGVSPAPHFRLAAAPAWAHDEALLEFGGTRALLLTLGPERRWAYVYLQARATLARATLHYTTGGAWQEVTDRAFPFEFSVPLPADATTFTFKVAGVRPSGETVASETGRLYP